MSHKIIAIHQPNFIPWIGYFIKMAACDVFVYHDNVEITKAGPTRRVKIASPHTMDNTQWLTVPLKKHSDFSLIKDLKLSYESDWIQKQLRQIYEAYRLCPFFRTYFPLIEVWYNDARQFSELAQLNIHFITKIRKLINLDNAFYLSSDIDIKSKSSDYNLQICNYFEATHYLSGKGAGKYQDEVIFRENKIEIKVLDSMKYLNENRYIQSSHSVSMGLSILDGLMNQGQENIERLIKTAIMV